MKNNTSYNTQNTGSKLNTTTALVLLIAALPILLFALTKMFPPTVDATAKETAISEAEAKRTSAAERRAQRAEERKAKRAEKAATTTARVQHGMAPDPAAFSAPMPPMEFNGFDGGFGPGFDNGMAMAPGGFGGGFGGPGFGGGFGGPGFGGPF